MFKKILVFIVLNLVFNVCHAQEDSLIITKNSCYPDTISSFEGYFISKETYIGVNKRIQKILSNTNINQLREDEVDFKLQLRANYNWIDGLDFYRSGVYKLQSVFISGVEDYKYLPFQDTSSTISLDYREYLKRIDSLYILYDNYGNKINLYKFFDERIKLFWEDGCGGFYGKDYFIKRYTLENFKLQCIDIINSHVLDNFNFLLFDNFGSISNRLVLERISYKKNGKVVVESVGYASTKLDDCELYKSLDPKMVCFYVSLITWKEDYKK